MEMNQTNEQTKKGYENSTKEVENGLKGIRYVLEASSLCAYTFLAFQFSFF